MDNKFKLLPLHPSDHPDCQAMRWREDEIRAIKDYAIKCIKANLPASNEQCAAIDEKTNARGEPEAIYLQLHDPDEIDNSDPADFRANGVTWCWHKINDNDVRYIREDLAKGAAVPAEIEVTDYMALAFHHALTDGPIGEDDLKAIKIGIRAALSAAGISYTVKG